MKIKCKCGYEWNTNSKMMWATCPSCRLKVKNPSIVQQSNGIKQIKSKE